MPITHAKVSALADNPAAAAAGKVLPSDWNAEHDTSGLVIADVSDATAAGQALVTAADAAAQRTALGLAASATTDTTNASNISSGTLNAARLPTGLCKSDTTSLAYNSAATVSMFTTGAADVIDRIVIVVDTAFDGSGPGMSVGVSGTPAKYVASTQVDLTATGQYEIHPGKTAQGAEALQIAFTAGGGASAGAARVLVHYSTPS